MKKIKSVLLGLIIPCILFADVTFTAKEPLKVFLPKGEEQVVYTAFEIFERDYKQVFDAKVVNTKKADVYIGTLGTKSVAEKKMDAKTVNELKNHPEGFALKVDGDKLYILGSDKRGTAYGILELSRLIGVSPWEWWADAPIAKKESFELKDGFNMVEYPDVKHRGIFINDEDWGLMPWSGKTYEPSDKKGNIGPQTHARIFELLLRLRANTFWPAMHKCSIAFYLIPGNKEMADKYAIYVGTSHCEPMVRNTNAEWNRNLRGRYDYVNNSDSVVKFWEERVIELAGSDNIYTLGIRGEHDSKMLGANTIAEQKAVISNVFKDQRALIAKHVNPDVTKVSQVFIPYKEVLDVYNAGLEVPDDVSLMWCDDNYGYIRHFPTSEERARKGGNGVYYHVSYWGRPHDYLWIASNHPAQLYTQMKMAYDKGARDMWILNVGDIKPAEYLTELFMDMAWDMDDIESNEQGLEKHLYDWMAREFGPRLAKELVPVMNEYYRLAYIRKPEFMGNTRTEEKDPKYKVLTDLPWSKEYVETRLADYIRISDKVVEMAKDIPVEKQDTWFQLVEYPVRGAAEMNKKHLYGSLARHGFAEWKLSNNAQDSINSLTRKYNSLNDGKWNKMMVANPRKLPVFGRLVIEKLSTPMPEDCKPLALLNGKDYVSFKGEKPVCYGMGYERGAIHMVKGCSVTYEVSVKDKSEIEITTALAPNHPIGGKQIRYSISVNGEQPQVVDYHTEGRSEEWKKNVLCNQALKKTRHVVDGKKAVIVITAMDEGVVLDQLTIKEPIK